MQNPTPTGDAQYGFEPADGWILPTEQVTPGADHDLYRRPEPAPQSGATPQSAATPQSGADADSESAGAPLRGDPDTRATLDSLDLAGWSTQPMEPDPLPEAGAEASDDGVHLPSISSYWPHPAPGRRDATSGDVRHDEAYDVGHDESGDVGRDETQDAWYGDEAPAVPAWAAQPGPDTAAWPFHDSGAQDGGAQDGGAQHGGAYGSGAQGSGAWPVTGPAPDARPRRRGVLVGALVGLLLVTGAGIAAVVARTASEPTPTAAVRVTPPAPLSGSPTGGPSSVAVEPAEPTKPVPIEPAPPSASPDDHVVSAPLAGRTGAHFDLVNGTSLVNVRMDALGDDLYRVSTPPDSSVVPKASSDGDQVRLFLVRSGDRGVGSVKILLNKRVRWDLRVTGGSDQSVLDLSGGRVEGVELAGGATRIDLTLPRPDGTLPVRMTGGVNQFLVHTADSVPVRVRVGSGAGRLVLDGRQVNGIAPGALFTPARWAAAGDRIDLNAVAGMAALTVDRD